MVLYRSKNIALTDQNGDAGEIDDSSGSLVIIDLAHHEIHEGNSYMCFAVNETADDGDKVNIAFKTGTTTSEWHLFPLGSTAGATALRLFEGPDFTDNSGSQINVFNRNRQNSNIPDIIDISQNPDEAGKAAQDISFNNATGLKIYEEYFGSDKDSGGRSRGEREIILKSDTLYVGEVESKEASLAYIHLILTWYEL